MLRSLVGSEMCIRDRESDAFDALDGSASHTTTTTVGTGGPSSPSRKQQIEDALKMLQRPTASFASFRKSNADFVSQLASSGSFVGNPRIMEQLLGLSLIHI
eukprot:TRINITY_DN16675_c0_g1_i2.p1 TRINITY_DN16675_c0_g1~~TRINITY_DN16675_c0_g1_i2.p1  ORF type:complete len:102 (+),score=21.30 TRINITY_DN16675_c0_g1_i2:139-444(+)